MVYHQALQFTDRQHDMPASVCLLFMTQ